MEAGADLQQAADAAVEHGAPLGRVRDAREQFQQRGFAGAVASDDAEHLAPLDVERGVA